MSKYWIHLSELKERYKYSVEEGEFKGTFEEYIDWFLKKMEGIKMPHSIINMEM